MTRYSRHISLQEIGEVGQQKLYDARILVVGAGGLGCPALQYLTAAGVGTIGIVDGDTVDESNLQRQVLFATSDIDRKKVHAAFDRLLMLNPDVSINPYPGHLSPQNALELIDGYDLVIDGTDNFSTRYLVNDACVKLNRPFVYGAIHRFEGQVSAFNLNEGPTYRCLFPNPPSPDQLPNCSEVGVLGVLPGIIGTMQATEAMKIILGIGEPLSGKLKVIDLLTNSEQVILFGRNKDQIEKARQIDLGSSYQDATCSTENEISAEQLAVWLDGRTDFHLLDVREPHETPKLEHPDVISIPLIQLPERMHELAGNGQLVVCCQRGVRSLKAIQVLKENGFLRPLINLKGGMMAFHQLTSRGVWPYAPINP